MNQRVIAVISIYLGKVWECLNDERATNRLVSRKWDEWEQNHHHHFWSRTAFPSCYHILNLQEELSDNRDWVQESDADTPWTRKGTEVNWINRGIWSQWIEWMYRSVYDLSISLHHALSPFRIAREHAKARDTDQFIGQKPETQSERARVPIERRQEGGTLSWLYVVSRRLSVHRHRATKRDRQDPCKKKKDKKGNMIPPRKEEDIGSENKKNRDQEQMAIKWSRILPWWAMERNSGTSEWEWNFKT